MKLLTIGAILVLLGGAVYGHNDQSKPHHARIQIRLFELPLSDLTRIQNAPTPAKPDMYAEVQKLQKQGKAKLVHLAVINTISGMRASTESIRETIYPTEYTSGFYITPQMRKELELPTDYSLIRPYGHPPHGI